MSRVNASKNVAKNTNRLDKQWVQQESTLHRVGEGVFCDYQRPMGGTDTWLHKTANVLHKLPESQHSQAKSTVRIRAELQISA